MVRIWKVGAVVVAVAAAEAEVVELVKEERLWRASVARDERRKPNAAAAMVNSEADSQAGRAGRAGGQRGNPRLRN